LPRRRSADGPRGPERGAGVKPCRAATGTPAPPPDLPHGYRDKVANPVEALNDESIKTEVIEPIRSLVDRVVLSPDGESPGLKAILNGNLATILAFCESAKDKQRQTADD
jgi:hypothetical protein